MAEPTRADLLATVDHLCQLTKDTLAQRNRAYAGDTGSVFGNLNLVETLSNGRLTTELGIVMRMGDKVSRLFQLLSDPAIPHSDEPIEDTIRDLIGYSSLLQLRHSTRTPRSNDAV